MNVSKRRLLTLTMVFAALLAVQCAEKEGPINPYVDTEPPPYIISSLGVNPQSVEPGEHAAVTALLVDRSGEPVVDYQIVFATTLGTIESPVTTDQDGFAIATYTAPGTTGTGVITASAEGAVSREITVQAGQGVLSASPASILADGISTSALSVLLLDADGEPAAGIPVVFSTTLGTIAVPSATTDTDGHASATLVSFSSKTDVVASVSAAFTLGGVPRSELALVEFRGVSVSVSADPAQVPADGLSVSSITAWVRETTGGAPLADAEVSFRTTAGAISGSSATDESGFAEAYLTSSTAPGVATVKVVYGGISDSTGVTFGSLVLSAVAAHPKMVADGASSQYITATLVTESNNPVAGVTIDFSSTHGIVAKSAVTNSRGQAEALLASPSHAAVAKVMASFKGVYEDTVEVGFQDPVLVLKSLPMSITAGSTTPAKVLAYVSFADDSPVPDNTSVVFSTTQGTITASALTASGIATAQLRPNGVADDQVIVRAACGNTAQTTQMVFTADAPGLVQCRALPDTVASGGTSFSTIAAEVTDAYGNPVEDGTLVTFSVVAGNGLVTPSGLTSGGVATARFTPSGGGIARVRAACGQAYADAGIVVLAQWPGAIVADPDTAWIAIGDAWDRSQAVITAHVFDSYMNPVDEGTEVSFQIDYGPGGGEYLDDESYGYGPVEKETSGGMALVTVNSGTKPGTLLMTITAGDHVSTAVKVGIAAGLPDSVFITTGEVVVGPDGVYVLAVAAIVRDAYNNPVENGTAVYFTLDRSDIGMINPEGVTGGLFPCIELTGTPNKGVAHACLKFPTSSMTEAYAIVAFCGDRQSTFETAIPIVTPANLRLGAVPGSVSAATGGDVTIVATLSDNFALPIQGATVAFAVDGVGTVNPAFAATDEYGACSAALSIPAGVEPGKTTVKATVFMTDIKADIDITITE